MGKKYRGWFWKKLEPYDDVGAGLYPSIGATGCTPGTEYPAMGENPGGCVCAAVRPMDATTTASEKMTGEDGADPDISGNEPSIVLVKDGADPDAGSIGRPSVVTMAGEVRAGEEKDEVAGNVAVVDPDAMALERAATAEAAERRRRRQRSPRSGSQALIPY